MAPSPPYGYLPGTMPPRVSPTSGESAPSPVEVPPLDLNTPTTPLVGHSPAAQTAAARAAAPAVVAPARNLFGEMPRPSPGDPRYFEKVHDEGDDVLQDMIRDNAGDEYGHNDYD